MSLNDYSSDEEYDEEVEEEEEQDEEEDKDIDSSVEVPRSEAPAPGADELQPVASTEAEVAQGGGRSQVQLVLAVLAGKRTWYSGQ